jgi:predicted nucleotidyltransferase
MAQIVAPGIIPTGRKTPVNQALQQAVRKIVKNLHPIRIILFGSYANGSPTPDSDVDLLIVMETDTPARERSWQVSRLLLPRPFPVDILVKTPTEISQALDQGDFFIQGIISRGIVLYERDK